MADPVRIVAVTGARDGVGRTTFAVNAALSLLKETRGRVLLVDLDRESCGDCASLLGMGPTKTLADFVPYADQLTAAQLRPYISSHPAGMGVLPLAPEPGADLDPAAVGKLLDLLRPLCDYVVVDAGVWVNDLSVQAFERAAALFVLTTADLAVLNHSRRFLDQLQALQFPREQV
ncbi:MAG: hypothetical protein H6740_29295, partial [Alphaproteobacteria bacterium]|nr:hypothetical protein [Alphaproteobacteria bacterium]